MLRAINTVAAVPRAIAFQSFAAAELDVDCYMIDAPAQRRENYAVLQGMWAQLSAAAESDAMVTVPVTPAGVLSPGKQCDGACFLEVQADAFGLHSPARR